MAWRRGAPKDLPDHYERAVRRIDTDRRAREMGDPIPELPPGLDVPMPGRRMRQTLLLLGGLVLLLVIGRVVSQSRAPSLPASCTAPQLKVEPAALRSGQAVRWSASGPAGTAVTLVLAGKAVSRPETTLAKCAASGSFVPTAPVGRHEVRLIDARTGAVLARQPLTIER